MGRKRKNLSELSIANGKVWDDNELNCSISSHPYKNTSLANYESEIRGMNKIDLDKHATSLFILPRENRDNLIDQLLKEFKNNL